MKAYLLPSALAVSLGINATLVGAGLAEATTIPRAINSVVSRVFPSTNPALTNIRSQTAAALCDDSVAAEGLAAGDCTAQNVCVVSLVYCDGDGVSLDTVNVSATMGYQGNLTLAQ